MHTMAATSSVCLAVHAWAAVDRYAWWTSRARQTTILDKKHLKSFKNKPIGNLTGIIFLLAAVLPQAVMQEEFKRGFEICREILVYKSNANGVTNWAKLFEPHKFFESKLAFYVLVGGTGKERDKAPGTH